MIEGKLNPKIADEVFEVYPGDSWSIPSNAEHSAEVSGRYRCITQIACGDDAPAETLQCVIHVKTLTDAPMDAVDDELAHPSDQAAEQQAV